MTLIDDIKLTLLEMEHGTISQAHAARDLRARIEQAERDGTYLVEMQADDRLACDIAARVLSKVGRGLSPKRLQGLRDQYDKRAAS